MKYIYFEIKHVSGYNSSEPVIENENVLLIKPLTNSSGIWGFRNITERKGFSKLSFLIVEQYWIDLDKFDSEKCHSNIKENLNQAMQKISERISK